MCGNGVRCAVKYLKDQKISSSKQITLETLGSNVSARIEGDTVTVDLPPPTRIQWNLPLTIGDESIHVHFLNTGVPHAVLFSAPQHLGPKIRHHTAFSPEGTNVTFVTPSHEEGLIFATYERGVEKITQACGTGALAAAVVANKILQLPSPITLYPPSREPLTVSFQTNGNQLSSISLTGPAKFLEEIPFSLEGNRVYL